jgi:hypothetical protein
MRCGVAIVYVAALAVLAAGCGSASVATGIANDDDLAAAKPLFEVTNLEAGQWALEYSMMAKRSTLEQVVRAARRVRAVSFVVYRPGGTVIDSLTREYVDLDFPAIARLSRDVSSTQLRVAYTGVKWVPKGLPSGNEYAMMMAWSDRGVHVRTEGLFAPITGTADSTLSLRITTATAGGAIHVTLTATRVAAYHAGEYRTTREPYIVRLTDGEGDVVWSSSSAETERFIGPVLPEGLRASQSFETSFDGIDRRNGRPLPSGRYTLVGEARAWPRSYVTQQEIVWGGK